MKCRLRYIILINVIQCNIAFIQQFTEAQLQLRTIGTHASHEADFDGPLHDHIATIYGVTQKSESLYFHVVKGLVPDIMHDMLEGTTQLTIKCLLHHFIGKEKLFSLATLNRRITSFDYGRPDACNKPSEISLSQSNS